MHTVTQRVKDALVMRFWVMGAVFLFGSVGGAFAQALDPAVLKLRANELGGHRYAIRLLKPIPRHNNGCDTVFRNGKALKTCDGNFGFNPERYGGILTFCRWDMLTTYSGDDSKEWSEPFFTSDLIPITESTDEWKVNNERETMYGRIRKIEMIKDRHIRIQFGNSNIGELNCYSGYPTRLRKNSDYYFGATSYHWGRAQQEVAYSGLSVEDIQRQLRSFIEIVTIR